MIIVSLGPNFILEVTLRNFCTIFFRYEVQTVGDVLDHLDDGLQHVIQAGIDRANQSARVTAHMICDWRIMPNQFTYEVKKNQLCGRQCMTVVTDYLNPMPKKPIERQDI